MSTKPETDGEGSKKEEGTMNTKPETDGEGSKKEEGHSVFAQRQIFSFLRNQHNKKMVKDAYKHCDPHVAELAACTRDKTFSVLWECRNQQSMLTQCLNEYSAAHQWVKPPEIPDARDAASKDPLRKK